MKTAIKRALTYRALAETAPAREAIAVSRRAKWPYLPDDEGDFLFQLARSLPGKDALEVGFATGSTAAYILSGLGTGQLTSIDYDQNHFERAGENLSAALGLANRHRLIERDSIKALPSWTMGTIRPGPLGGWTQRRRYLATTRSRHRPYVALRKTVEVSATEAGRQYDFWKPF